MSILWNAQITYTVIMNSANVKACTIFNIHRDSPQSEARRNLRVSNFFCHDSKHSTAREKSHDDKLCARYINSQNSGRYIDIHSLELDDICLCHQNIASIYHRLLSFMHVWLSIRMIRGNMCAESSKRMQNATELMQTPFDSGVYAIWQDCSRKAIYLHQTEQQTDYAVIIRRSVQLDVKS